ncbi:MAG TPA: SpoIIE family protein phosphatase [Clostridiales bacterium]|jgi:stage II sporulation protein E|nr:SpoIIE family protein phosphatase [Clostridiales bacterium]
MQNQRQGSGRRQAVERGLPAAGMKLRQRAFVDEAVRGLAYAGAAYLLGGCRLPFGSYPLGLALFCASGKWIPYILIGLIASTPAVPYPSVYIGVYIITFLLRAATRIFIDTADGGEAPSAPSTRLKWLRARFFNENISLRMTTSSLCAFISGLYTIIAGGYRYYDLFGALFSIILSPALVWLLAGWFAGDGGDIKKRLRYLAGAAVLLGGLCYSARDIVIMGISAAAFSAFFVTLWVCRRHGVLAGAAAGLICGVAYEPVYAPLFVLAGIAEGLLYGVSPTLATAAAFASGMTWGLYIDGTDALTRLLPGLLLSSAAFCGAERAGLLGLSGTGELPSVKEEKLIAETERAKRRIKSDEDKLLAVSGSFASLSEIFYSLSDRLRRPGIIDLRRICDRVFDKTCTGCAKRDICWGLEYGYSLDMMAKLCSGLHERGRAEADCIPESIKKRCPNIPQIIADINSGCASLTESVLRGEKIGIFALDYDAMSRILIDAVEEMRADFERAGDTESRVLGALANLGIIPSVLYVYGGRRKFISARGIDAAGTKTDAGAIKRALERITGCRLEDPLFEFCDGRGQRLSMTLTTKRKYAVERACQTAAGELSDGVCGDSAVMFETENDYFYALISDGMGTGGDAAFSSGVCSIFLEKMLVAGNKITTALRMLNGVLRSRGGARELECSATVDLLEVDLLTGAAALIKSGAAPTYVRRAGGIFKLQSKTLPIGILSALDAQLTRLEVSEGDVVVMLSDGVLDAAKEKERENEAGRTECEGWLPNLLSREWEEDLGRMAKKIIGRAQSLGARDDLSVIIVRIGLY